MLNPLNELHLLSSMDLSSVVAIDSHAYPLLTEANAASLSLTAAFLPRMATDMIEQSAWPTLSYLRSRRDIAEFLACDPTEEAIQACRDRIGLESLAQKCLDAANLEAMFLEDGWFPESSLPLEEHRTLIPTYRLIHLEALAERLMAEVDRFDVFLEWFRSELDLTVPHVVGLVSTAAQRSGLAIQWVYREMAEACFDGIKGRSPTPGHPIQLREKELIDFLLFEALNAAVAEGVPLQFDLGVGVAPLTASLANPVLLSPLLEEPTYQSVPIVLRGGASLFSKESALLAAMYPQVFVDMGGLVTSLSVRGMKQRMQGLIAQAPLNKILYASGARFFPEVFYLGATWGREILGQALEEAVSDRDLSAAEAEEGAVAILRGTAQKIYVKERDVTGDTGCAQVSQRPA
ncbi:MAG: hypothetical protein VKL39_11300, partial [Leptolyngbyaceae bacterium]|nr:hypothetical protein [Leptolyngbyaceae bacterium]